MLGRRRRRLLSCGCLFAVGGAIGTAWAQPASAPRFSLEVSSADGCPGDAELERAIMLRVPQARRVEVGQAELSFRVTIADQGVSSVLVTSRDRESLREIPSTSCDGALAGIALIATLALDTLAAEPAAAADPASRDHAPEPSAPAPQEEPRSLPRVTERARATPTSARDETTRPVALRWSADLAMVTESAVAPAPPLGGMLGLGAVWDRSSLWSPEFRADLFLTRQADQTAGAGTATLQLLAGRLSVCPLRLPRTGSFGLAPCVTFDAGYLRAQGATAINGNTSDMPWLAPGLELRGEARLTRALSVALSTGLKRLVYNDRFTLRPDEALVYNVPAFSAGVSVGVKVRL